MKWDCLIERWSSIPSERSFVACTDWVTDKIELERFELKAKISAGIRSLPQQQHIEAIDVNKLGICLLFIHLELPCKSFKTFLQLKLINFLFQKEEWKILFQILRFVHLNWIGCLLLHSSFAAFFHVSSILRLRFVFTLCHRHLSNLPSLLLFFAFI